MANFFQQIISGLAVGSVYACFALALVMAYRASHAVNFAQGEMAMVGAYVTWALISAGWPYWAALLVSAAVCCAFALLFERVLISSINKSNELNMVIATVGLLLILNSVIGWIFTYDSKPFPSPFGEGAFAASGLVLTHHEFGLMVVTLIVMLAVFAMFTYTNVGLILRAVALDQTSTRLMGLRVSWYLAFGWGIAASVGAVAGTLIAPSIFLSPHMMMGVMIYGLASAVLGGLESAIGAVVGGLLMGVAENLIGTYISFIGSSLKLPCALLIILLILIGRPNGIFGRVSQQRV